MLFSLFQITLVLLGERIRLLNNDDLAISFLTELLLIQLQCLLEHRVLVHFEVEMLV